MTCGFTVAYNRKDFSTPAAEENRKKSEGNTKVIFTLSLYYHLESSDGQLGQL